MEDKNTIPFVTELSSYVGHRNKKISEKNSALLSLREQLKDKKERIAKAEAEYKQTFDDELFDNLIQLKKDADSIKDDINKTSEVIALMGTGEFNYDLKMLENEIDTYIEKSGLNKLKEAVIVAKENYLKAISSYEDKLKDIYSVRSSMDSMADNIPKNVQQKILQTLTKHSKELTYSDDMFIPKYEYDNMPIKINGEAIRIYMNSPYGL